MVPNSVVGYAVPTQSQNSHRLLGSQDVARAKRMDRGGFLSLVETIPARIALVPHSPFSGGRAYSTRIDGESLMCKAGTANPLAG